MLWWCWSWQISVLRAFEDKNVMLWRYFTSKNNSTSRTSRKSRSNTSRFGETLRKFENWNENVWLAYGRTFSILALLADRDKSFCSRTFSYIFICWNQMLKSSFNEIKFLTHIHMVDKKQWSLRQFLDCRFLGDKSENSLNF